jgi:hypothetical protein
VRSFPNVDAGRWTISTNGGFDPVWSDDGTELFYKSGTELIAVEIATNPTFAPGRQTTLFSVDGYMNQGNFVQYDVGRDGRFVMLKAAAGTVDATRLILVQNFFEELRARTAN